MAGRLAGRRAFITGATRGIGLAIAQHFAREGATLALLARDSTRLAEVAVNLRRDGASVQTLACDVTDRDGARAAVEECIASGGIDVLVNNAGTYVAKPFVEYAPEDFMHVFDVNVMGVVNITQAVVRHMIDRGSGNVVNVASSAGKWGSRNQSAYNMSKHALVGLTRCLALELAPHKIRVNAVCPWIVDTDMGSNFVREHGAINAVDADQQKETLLRAIPLHDRFIHPDEVATLAVYLAADESSYVTGQAWSVDGGYTML